MVRAGVTLLLLGSMALWALDRAFVDRPRVIALDRLEDGAWVCELPSSWSERPRITLRIEVAHHGDTGRGISPEGLDQARWSIVRHGAPETVAEGSTEGTFTWESPHELKSVFHRELLAPLPRSEGRARFRIDGFEPVFPETIAAPEISGDVDLFLLLHRLPRPNTPDHPLLGIPFAIALLSMLIGTILILPRAFRQLRHRKGPGGDAGRGDQPH